MRLLKKDCSAPCRHCEKDGVRLFSDEAISKSGIASPLPFCFAKRSSGVRNDEKGIFQRSHYD